MVVNTLPSTPLTKHMLSGDVLQACKGSNCMLINVGRGDIVSESSIINAIDKQWISCAVLDVFETEPLPEDSPLWNHPNITVTPHVSALSFSNDAVACIASNIEKIVAGSELLHTVDWQNEY